MKLVFDDFELDSATAELRKKGAPVAVEKQAFDLLLLLADNAERVLSKEEIIEKVWDGRFITDSSISTAVKQARRAVGDDGAAQRVIKTVHGRGFRFVADVKRPAEVVESETASTQEIVLDDTPSIAVLPFAVIGEGPVGPAIGDAIPAELISAFSRLRWLMVTSRGSSFRFRDPATSHETLRNALGVRYALLGTVEALGDMLTISVELIRTDTGAVIWSSRYASALAEIHEVRTEIVHHTVAALEIHIPFSEASIARTLAPDQIGAWSHFHLGLQRLYRFNQADNLVAADHFRRALELETDFARAHAGLSFVHWQTAFLHFGEDRTAPLAEAAEHARIANDIDPHDPFANYNMARVHWLQGDVDGFSDWLDRAVSINPNYAQATYAMAMANNFAGRHDEAVNNASMAMRLSPLDPMKYAMMSTQAIGMVADGQVDAAASQVEKACHLPGAHFYIDLIAAACHKTAGNEAQAEMRARRVRERRPDLTRAMFFSDFPFRTDVDLRGVLDTSLTELGF